MYLYKKSPLFLLRHILSQRRLKVINSLSIRKVIERAKLKTSISRLINILSPELEDAVSTLHLVCVYTLPYEFPSASAIASAHLTRLSHPIIEASKGLYTKENAINIREAARNSIGSHISAKSLELIHTIKLVCEIDSENKEIELETKTIIDKITSPILSIPCISYRMGAMSIAEIGNFSRFDSPDKIFAYVDMSPSIYQSGHLDN